MKNTMDYLTIALPKGKLFSLSADLLAKAGYTAEGLSDKSRKLVIANEEKKIRFIVSKTADVPTYVEYGAADIGVIGKDVLLESGKDVYELLDLGFGRCHLMMAVPKAEKRAKLVDYDHTRVATKFPHIAEQFFNKHGMQMEYIKLNGSIELGPIVGLSESIVERPRGDRLHPRCDGATHRQPRELQAQVRPHQPAHRRAAQDPRARAAGKGRGLSAPAKMR